MNRRAVQIFWCFCAVLTVTNCSAPENGAERLSKVNPLYVALESKSLDSLNRAVGPSLENYGAVTASDFVPIYKDEGFMMEGSEQYGPSVFTDEKNVPSGTMYMTVNPRQLFEAMIAKHVFSIVVDKDTGKSFPVVCAQMGSVLKKLPVSTPLPLDVRVAR